MAKKIHSKNSFELCYLRHTYLRKTTYNPSKEEYAAYSHVIYNRAGKTYFIYKKLFYAVGFDFIDIVRVGETSLAPFLQMFAIEVDKVKFDKFVDAFCDKNHVLPTEKDILDKNKAIFTIILKQRMETLVRNCRQKVKNVRGVPMQEYHIFSGSRQIDVKNDELVVNFHKYGYKKVDLAVFRSIKKKAKPENPLHFNFNNTWYISIPTDYKPLELLDFSNAGLDPRDSIHNMNPEEVMSLSESTKKWRIEYKKFKRIPSSDRKDMIKLFIENNEGNKLFEEELNTAKKILVRMES